MKKILVLFLLLLLTGCSINTKDYGKFYKLEAAYNEGIISRDDLLTLAYINNNGNEYNENNINDDFKPKEINENDLTSVILHKIKSTASESKEEYDSCNVSFYGKYNEAYAIKLSSTLDDIPAVETSYYIDEIYFSFPTLEILIFVLN